MLKVLTTTLPNDDPAHIDEVIKHSLGENSKTRIAIDDLANVINTTTTDIELHGMSAPMIHKVADDDPVSTAYTAVVPPVIKVAISMLADDDPSTIISNIKKALSSMTHPQLLSLLLNHL